MARASERSAKSPSKTVEDVFRDLVRRSPLERPWSVAALRDLFEWPPDAFAFTSAILAESGAYRLAISPPKAQRWPPKKAEDGEDWKDSVTELADSWLFLALGWGRRPPALSRLARTIHELRSLPVRNLCEPSHWASTCALLTLHAAADEACAGVGISVASQDPSAMSPEEVIFLMAANGMLLNEGTLSNLNREIVLVAPKIRTPQVGISLRSLSLNLCVQRSEVDLRWMIAEGLAPPDEGRLNLLLVPAPMSLENTAFRPAPNAQLDNMDRERFGLFDFEPAEQLDVERVAAAIDEAIRKVGMVHGVIFPEEALTEYELARLMKVLLPRKDRSPRFIIAGVRGARLNTAVLAIRYENEWRTSPQNKHHRWCLDETQIRTYELTSALHPKVRWWENIAVTERQLQFVNVNAWLTFCHLICEDLARQDPVAQTVRTVGPTLVIALLQDGPQLRSRWPARYAGVLADDPGSSVLTLTSLGMAMRSRPTGYDPSRVIALWKDSQQGEREIALEEGSYAVILTTCADQTVVEWAADGRSYDGVNAQITFGGYEQVRASPTERAPAPRRRRGRPASRPRPRP